MIIYLAITTLITLLSSAIWYMSPLALGFAAWPADPDKAELAHWLFNLSHQFGISLILAAQVFAIVMAFKGYQRVALIVPAVCLVIFLLCVVTVIKLVQ